LISSYKLKQTFFVRFLLKTNQKVFYNILAVLLSRLRKPFINQAVANEQKETKLCKFIIFILQRKILSTFVFSLKKEEHLLHQSFYIPNGSKSLRLACNFLQQIPNAIRHLTCLVKLIKVN